MGESRTLTQTHVDAVYAERNAIGKGRKNVDGIRAADGFGFKIVREHFTDDELRLRSNADKRFSRLLVDDFVIVLPRNDPRNVCAVRGVRRIYFGIVVRIVVSIGHFRTEIDVVYALDAAALIRFETGNFFCNAVFGHGRRIGLRRKRRMRVIEPRIQNRGNHPFALLFDIFRIVNSRRIDVRIVGNRNGGNAVRLGRIDFFDFAHGPYGCNVAVFHFDRHTVVECGIRIFIFVRNSVCGKTV